MATKNTKAAKPTKSTKPESVAKKAAPEETQAMAKPEKAAKTAAKKDTIAPKDILKSNAKGEAIKKATPAKSKPVSKKDTNAAPAEKKATPIKKADSAKNTVAAKTEESEAVAAPKKAPKTPAKETIKEVAPKPVVKEAKPAAKTPPPPPPAKKAVVKKPITVAQMPVKPAAPSPRPMATPAARSTEKKPTVVIAHRRLENKSKEVKEVANTMIQYQPETYRSILDEPTQQQGPIYRYSDEDLNEFREIINSRLDAARKELNYLQGLITRKDEAGTEDTENRYMNMEDGSGAMEREQLAQLASRQIQFMGHLEKALVRIENKTYGICRVTGKLIDKARLRAVPHATLSIDAKKMLGSKQN